MEWYIDIGFAVLIRLLKERRETNKWRRAFLKLFKAIADAYRNDEEFAAMMAAPQPKGG